MNSIAKRFVMFGFGACFYGLCEIIWRGYTHWSMIIAGGICFLFLGLLSNAMGGDISFLMLSVIGACIITAVEFIFGLVFNIWLGMDVWDYSSMPLNVMGQICLPFFAIWIAVSAGGLYAYKFLVNIMDEKMYRKNPHPERQH